MPHTGSVQKFTILINGASSINDFIITVIVDIAHRKVVITLPVCTFSIGSRIVYPTLRQILSVEVICHQRRTLVIAPTHHQTRMYTVEISDTSQITFRPVEIIVFAPIFTVSSSRGIFYGNNFCSGFSVEYREVFGTTCYDTCVFPIGSVIFSGVIIIHQYVISFPIDRARGRFTGHFGLTVSIEVIHHKLGVMRTGPYVFSEIDTPEFLSIEFVTVEVDFPCVTPLGIIT